MSAERVPPLPGPLDRDPTSDVYDLAGGQPHVPDDLIRPRTLARAMLTTALEDVQLDTWDEYVITWLKSWDVGTIATVASLMRRCWEAGVTVGYSEVVDEQSAVQRAQAEVEALTRTVDHLHAALDGVEGADDAYRSAAVRATDALALIDRAVEDAQAALDDEGFDRQVVVDALIGAIRHALAPLRDEGVQP